MATLSQAVLEARNARLAGASDDVPNTTSTAEPFKWLAMQDKLVRKLSDAADEQSALAVLRTAKATELQAARVADGVRPVSDSLLAIFGW